MSGPNCGELRSGTNPLRLHGQTADAELKTAEGHAAELCEHTLVLELLECWVTPVLITMSVDS